MLQQSQLNVREQEARVLHIEAKAKAIELQN